MPIHLHRPDEYDKLTSFPAAALVDTVNCVGVAGKGVALAFRLAFPENFLTYRDACRSGRVGPGNLFVTETCVIPTWVGTPIPRQADLFAEVHPKCIVNFPTKRHW